MKLHLNKKLEIVILVAIIAMLFAAVFSQLPIKTQTKMYKIGAVLPLTGLESRQGELINKGIMLAAEDIENLYGESIELIVQDDKSDAKEAINAFAFLKEQHNISTILTIGSPVAMSLSPLANKDKIILFSIAATPAYKSLDDYTFRVIPSAEKEGKDMAKLSFQKLGIRKIAVIYANNDYGIGTKTSFVSFFKQEGGEILIEESFDPLSTDFRTNLIKIKGKNPDAIYIASWGVQAGIIARQARELGIRIQLLCSQACQNPDLIKEGSNAVEGLIYPYTFLNTTTDFYFRFRERFGEEPTQISERMYDTTKLSYALIKKCDENKTCMLDELRDIRFNGTSSIIQFDEFGDIIEDFVLYTVKDGKFVLYE